MATDPEALQRMKWFASLIDRIRAWYRGVKLPDFPNDPHSDLIFCMPDRYEQPPLAKFLGVLGRSWCAHWQWIVGTILAVIGLFIAL